MGSLAFLLSALGGAALMYILDPDRGRLRRALLREQLIKITNQTQDRLDDAAHEARNRAEGMAAEIDQRMHAETVNDETLVSRVRSAIGRVVSNAGAIEVTARQGRISLSGPVLQKEVSALLATARVVPGVTEVENRLQVHEEAGRLSSLQGTSQ